MGLFNKKPTPIAEIKPLRILNSNKREYYYEITENELKFIISFENLLIDSDKILMRYERYSDGSILCSFGRYPVGRIRLQKKKHWMQIIDEDTIHGELDDFIAAIPKWLKYIESIKEIWKL